MTINLDWRVNRRNSYSTKWTTYPADVLPLWVADMDLPSPEPVLRALRAQVEHGIFGYAEVPTEMRDLICERTSQLYGWKIDPSDIVFFHGVISALGYCCRAFATHGEGVLMQTPVYHPFLTIPGLNGLVAQTAPLELRSDVHTLSYEVDFAAFDAAVTPQTRLFFLCNPHNPTGHVWRREELERLAEICLRYNVLIVSDEIHCELILGDARHTPIASLAPEVAERTITLSSPSKAFNQPGLDFAFAIVRNPDLRARLQAMREALEAPVSILGVAATLATYREGDEWLAELLSYLRRNRDLVVDFVRNELTGFKSTEPEATYLAWLDCRAAELPDGPFSFFLNRAQVALSDGAKFGENGKGFVRLNFGCHRDTLMTALERMRDAVRQHLG